MSDIEALRQRLGLTAAPLVNAGLAATEHFFRTVLTADALEWWEYLRGIDFHKPVQVKWLEPRTPLVRYDNPVRREIKKITPFIYFTEPGVSPFQTGTSWPTWDYRLYNVVVRTPALVSTASSISFDPADRVSRVGGGVQYILSRADSPKRCGWVKHGRPSDSRFSFQAAEEAERTQGLSAQGSQRENPISAISGLNCNS